MVMHTFRLIHKDIKPANILVTEDGTVLLADFGISTHVLETAGETSLTFSEGTFRFMSPKMKELEKHRPGEVDLYHNDMHGLKVTMSSLQPVQDIESSRRRTPRR